MYAALLDPEALACWRVPEGMTTVVHEFEELGMRMALESLARLVET